MVWLGRASLKPCSGKLCFGRFRAALVHVEALSTDQLIKKEDGYVGALSRWLRALLLAGPGFLELWSGWAGLP